MRIFDNFGSTCQLTVLNAMASYAKAWLAENTESEETELEVAVSYGGLFMLDEEDFEPVVWSGIQAFGGPLPPRPPQP